MKKFMSVLLMVCMLLSGASSVFAAEPEVKGTAVEPRGIALKFGDSEKRNVRATIAGVEQTGTLTISINGSYTITNGVVTVNSLTATISESKSELKARVVNKAYKIYSDHILVTITSNYNFVTSNGASPNTILTSRFTIPV